MTFIKKGHWGQNFMKTNFFFAFVTLGGVELSMIQFPSLNFLAHLHCNFLYFPIFGQIEYNMVSIFSKFYRFYSMAYNIKWKTIDRGALTTPSTKCIVSIPRSPSIYFSGGTWHPCFTTVCTSIQNYSWKYEATSVYG